jgi:hypothetical protein
VTCVICCLDCVRDVLLFGTSALACMFVADSWNCGRLQLKAEHVLIMREVKIILDVCASVLAK